MREHPVEAVDGNSGAMAPLQDATVQPGELSLATAGHLPLRYGHNESDKYHLLLLYQLSCPWREELDAQLADRNRI